MAKSNKKKKTPPTEEQLLKRQKSAFKRRIRNVFTGAGFSYIPTNDHENVYWASQNRSRFPVYI